MWRNISVLLVLMLVLVGCTTPRDPETLFIALNPGVDTIEVGYDYQDPGATATLSGQQHPYEVIENTVDVTKVGTYRIVYEVSYRGVTQHVTRIVDVIDTTPPDITLNPGVDTVILNGTWVDAGVTVSDNSGLDVTVVIDGEVVTSMTGEYRITYVATDAFGNQSEMVRFVHVIDPQ